MTSLNRKPVVADLRIDAVVRAVPCAFCQHANPSDSRYCNRCGAPLAAAPCQLCGTISDAGAHACKNCGADLGDRGGDALFQPLPPAFKPGVAPAANREPPEPVPSWDTPLFILDPPGALAPARDAAPASVPEPVLAPAPAGDAIAAPRTSTRGLNKAVIRAAAILAVLGAVALLVSRHDARDESPLPAASSGTVTVAPAAAEPARVPPAASKVDTMPVRAASVPASAVPAAAAPRPRTDTASPPARSTVETAPAVAPPAARIGPCTEAVAALGLCTLPAAPAKE